MPRARALGGPVYTNKTQTAAAEAFLRANRGKVGLITVSIGGNDVTKCVSEADATTCVAEAVKVIKTNVTKLAKRLRAAAGPNVRIVGITYPDVVLGLWTTGSSPTRISRSSPCSPSVGSSTRRSRIPTPR